MPRFFSNPPNEQNQIIIVGEDARHITKSLRMNQGDSLITTDGLGMDYSCTIVTVGEEVVLTVDSSQKNTTEPATKIYLYQALPKGEKMDFIVQKSVELGVFQITPCLSERCISRPDSKSMEKKLQKLNRTAKEAAKQSGRGIVPCVSHLLPLSQVIQEMSQLQYSAFLYENAVQPLRSSLPSQPPSTIGILIGAEGGFSPTEAEQIVQAGIPAISLGPRILRCETAPVATISNILFYYQQ